MKSYLAVVLALSCSMVVSLAVFGQDNGSTDSQLIERKHQLVQVVVTGDPVETTSFQTFKGTGFIVSPKGYIVTALHTLKDDSYWQRKPSGELSRRITVRFVDSLGALEPVVRTAILKKTSPENDTALIWVQSDKELPFVTCKSDLIPPTVSIMGFDEGDNFKTDDGTAKQSETDPDHLVVKADSVYGMSGGPAIDPKSTDVVGIVVERIEPSGTARTRTDIVKIGEAIHDFEDKVDCFKKPNPEEVDLGSIEYVDFGDYLSKATSNDVTIVAKGVRVAGGDYVLAGRNLTIRADVLAIDGAATIRAFSGPATPGAPGERGSPGGTSSGDGKNGGPGTPGGDGRPGHPGSDGKSAGHLIFDVKHVVILGGSLQVLDRGQQGGQGGRGGTGGQGGSGSKGRNRGGNAFCSNAKSPGNGGRGGEGGAGGPGGMGGPGGDGGFVEFTDAIAAQIAAERIAVEVGAGLGGPGGPGGAGGTGGSGGAGGDGSNCGGGGDRGPNGANGTGGGKGPDGGSKSVGSIGILSH